VDPVADVLDRLERGDLGDADAVVAYLAGGEVALPDDELNEARRRALLLLAAGGDPRRQLGVDARAVKALAVDLWSDARGDALLAGLDALAVRARELPRVRATVLALVRDRELAWRLYALALLAEELGDDE
jgi:hypothetical protein